MKSLFPSYKEEEVIRRVKQAWDLSLDFPMPKFDLRCPVCGSFDIQARNWQFVFKDSGGCKYRCNVSLKCTYCSAVWIHGIVIPEELFRRHVKENEHQTRLYHWREVKEWLQHKT